jgi:hypothetical protein
MSDRAVSAGRHILENAYGDILCRGAGLPRKLAATRNASLLRIFGSIIPSRMSRHNQMPRRERARTTYP